MPDKPIESPRPQLPKHVGEKTDPGMVIANPAYVNRKVGEAEARGDTKLAEARQHIEQQFEQQLASAGMRPAFVPSNRTPFWAAVFVGTMMSAGPALMNETLSWRVVLASALMGAAASTATFFGMRSAGVQRSGDHQ